MGDFNINLLNYNSDRTVKNIFDVLTSYSFYPTINKPTRITDISSTLIDNIFTNDYSNHCAGVLVTDVSDHLPVFLVVDNIKKKFRTDSNLKRDYSDENIEHFIDDLNETDWSFITSHVVINVAYDILIDHIVNLYNHNFSQFEVNLHFNKYKSHGLTNGIYNSTDITKKNAT